MVVSLNVSSSNNFGAVIDCYLLDSSLSRLGASPVLP